jgi:hypothetical protein
VEQEISGGGGGAGGHRSSFPGGTKLVLEGGSYPITVGGGGAGGVQPINPGADGNPSIFSTITSVQVVEVDQVIVVLLRNFQEDLEVQEVGLWNQVQQGLGNSPPTSPPQGNNGGTTAPGSGVGGGGGGIGSVGGNGGPDGTPGGPGGTGSANSITGSPVTRAGGGGGGVPSTGAAGGAGRWWIRNWLSWNKGIQGS